MIVTEVQAWAEYYAQGGRDPTGTIYFISVPGVSDATSVAPSPTAAQGRPFSSQKPMKKAKTGLLGLLEKAYTKRVRKRHSNGKKPEVTSPSLAWNPIGDLPEAFGSRYSIRF
ncbi:hypothetical protein C8J56DRAFT_378747 [Mycena floridula]|nr:hypothetical protein C8J56DRAFT_378747 [Mycena floridula]